MTSSSNPTAASISPILAAVLPGDEDEEAEEGKLRAIRRFQAEETLRIGLHDVAGDLEPEEVAGGLTDLAEVCLQQGIQAAWPGLAARRWDLVR